MEVVVVISKLSEEKIFVPKAKRVKTKKEHHKNNKLSDKKNKHQLTLLKGLRSKNTKSMNLDFISFDEINRDFNDLRNKNEEEICYDEINNILSSSSEDSTNNHKNKSEIIKRPKKTSIGNVNL